MISSETRLQYARIRLVDTGVRPAPFAHTAAPAVPFTIILEPLFFGILPASVAPTLCFLLPIVIVAWAVVVPRVHRYLRAVAEDIREERLKSE